jgi:hypothetical protein
MLDYRVMVCDPRDSYEPDNPVENVERLHCMPDEAVQACTGNPRCDDRGVLLDIDRCGEHGVHG